MLVESRSPARFRSFAPAAITAACGAFLVGDFYVDDAFITFRYAANLADHGSLSYNVPGQDGPGYSNPGYIVLLAALRLLTSGLISSEVFSRFIAVLSLGMLALQVFAASGRKGGVAGRIGTGLVMFTLILTFPYLLPNFFSGLETGLFTAAVFFVMRSWLAQKTANWKDDLWLAIALSLRFDAVVLLGPVVLTRLAWAVRARNYRRVMSTVIACLVAGAIFAATACLAGHVMPLSYAHKRIGSDFWNTVGEYIVMTASTVGIIWASGTLSRMPLGHERPRRLALYCVYVIVFYGSFNNWMFYRYAFPFLFGAALLIALDLLERTSDRPARLRWPVALATGVVFIGWLPPAYAWISGYRISGLPALAEAAITLKDSALPGEQRILASHDAGFLPYYSRWRFIDLQGLTTSEVRFERVGDVVNRLRPTVLLASMFEPRPANDVVLTSPFQTAPDRIPDGYRFVTRIPLVNRYWSPGADYAYYVFVTADAPADLIERLQNVKVDPEGRIGYQRWVAAVLRRLDWMAWLR